MLSFGLVSPITALASCNPQRGSSWANYHAGGVEYLGSGSVGGAGSNLNEYSPFVNNGESVAWTMVNAGGSNWAQSGWEQWSNVRYWFVQYTKGGSYYEDDRSALGGSNNRYTTTFNPPNEVLFYENGSFYENVYVDWTPDTAEFSSEITNQSSQMPGGYNNHMLFQTSKVWTPAGSSGSWQVEAGQTANDNGAISGANDQQNGRIDSWDVACAS